MPGMMLHADLPGPSPAALEHGEQPFQSKVSVAFVPVLGVKGYRIWIVTAGCVQRIVKHAALAALAGCVQHAALPALPAARDPAFTSPHSAEPCTSRLAGLWFQWF